MRLLPDRSPAAPGDEPERPVRLGRPDPLCAAGADPGQTPEQSGAAADQRALWSMIDARRVPHACHLHPPVATVADSGAVHAAIPGQHSRNLFLTDRRGALWLVSLPDTAMADLKALAPMLARDAQTRGGDGRIGRLSFASPDALWAACRLRPGSVTPLGVIADRDGRVRVVIDTALAIAPTTCVHPLRNDATLSLSGPHLIDMLDAMGHAPLVVAIPRRAPPAVATRPQEE